MNRNNKNELIADVYRAKLVYQAEMKSPEYRAKGEEDFEFIGKALAAKGYCKTSDVAREIINEVQSKIQIMISSIKAQEENGNITEFNGGAKTALEIVFKDLAERKKKYTEGE